MTAITLSKLIEDSVKDINTGVNSERNNEIAMKYFGFDGQGGCSMQAAGADYSLTRESVRQITNKISQILRDGFKVPESLHIAASIIDNNTPSSAERIEGILVKEGILDEGFKVEGVIKLIQIMDFKGLKLSSDQIVKHNNVRFVVAKPQLKLPQTIESAAISEISHNGAASIDIIAKSIKVSPKEVKLAFVKSVVETMECIKWIGNEQEWFFLESKGRNRLLSRLEQIFTLIESATAKDIILAIERSWKKNYIEDKTRTLPIEVLVELLITTGLYDIDGDLVRTKEKPELTDNINKFELHIFNMIKNSKSGICREKELEDAIVTDKNGKNKWGFSIALNHSPLIIKHEEKRGLYQLVGTAR